MSVSRFANIGSIKLLLSGADGPRESPSLHVNRSHYTVPVAHVKPGRAVRAFLAPATSYVAILDTDGRVVYTGIGSEQDIDAAVLEALNPTE